jgi:hypothetical protein
MKQYLESLIKDAEVALKTLPLKEEVVISLQDIENITCSCGIYIIEELSGDKQKTYNAFAEHKRKEYVAMPKLNFPSNILYVGSSRRNLKSRLLQHAGQCYKGTYALHLKNWFVGEIKITVREYDVSDSVLQLIEDGISFELKPAFGKTGSNNK